MYPAEPRLPGGAPREEGGYGGAGGGGGRVSYHGHHGSGRRGERGGRHEGWRGGERARCVARGRTKSGRVRGACARRGAPPPLPPPGGRAPVFWVALCARGRRAGWHTGRTARASRCCPARLRQTSLQRARLFAHRRAAAQATGRDGAVASPRRAASRRVASRRVAGSRRGGAPLFRGPSSESFGAKLLRAAVRSGAPSRGEGVAARDARGLCHACIMHPRHHASAFVRVADGRLRVAFLLLVGTARTRDGTARGTTTTHTTTRTGMRSGTAMVVGLASAAAGARHRRGRWWLRWCWCCACR